MSKELIKPYGDTLNDGIVQLSFTLPVENCAKAKKAAEMYVSKLNFEDISVVHSESISRSFTYFVVFARAKPSLDYSVVKANEVEIKKMNFEEINETIKNKLNRPLSVIGASIGSDAHTVGIDAIINMKGYKQDYGLERYPMIKVYNMGAQVLCESLIKKTLEIKTDVILVSQTVTQKESHIRNFTELIELLEAENIRSEFLLIAGGAKITNDFAVELGYDAGFGVGTLPSQVAAFLAAKIKTEYKDRKSGAEGKGKDY